VAKERISRIFSLLTARFYLSSSFFFFQNIKGPPPFLFFHVPECLLSRCHCFVSFWGGVSQNSGGLEVRVMDSLAFEFRGFFMVFCWVFGGGVGINKGRYGGGKRMLRRRGRGRRW